MRTELSTHRQGGPSHRPAILVIGGKLKIVQKAHALGLDVVYFQQPELYTDRHREYVRAALLFDYTDIAQAVDFAQAAHRRYGLRHAVSLTENGLAVTGHVNDALGLPGCGAEVALLFMDKWRMRQHLAGAGPALHPVAARPISGTGELRRFGDRHGWPVIVKPADSSASVGVFRVEGPHQVDEVYRRMQRLRHAPERPQLAVERFIVEEYLPGPEYSVEALSFGGRHVVLAITEKLLADGGFVEIGHALPARLAPDLAGRIVDATVSFLDAVGLRDGPSHTEFRLGDGSPKIIESHNRVGGDRLHDLVAAAYGVDQDEVAVSWPLGLLPPLAGPPPARCAAATRFFVADPGQVVAIEGVEEVSRHPAVVTLDVTVAVGDLVRPLRTSWDRAGQIVVTAATTAEAVALAEQLAGQVRIVTT